MKLQRVSASGLGLVLLMLAVAGCAAPGGPAVAPASVPLPFRAVNWARSGDNFSNGPLVLSGVGAQDLYDAALSHAKAICAQFQTKVGANTVRIPINAATVQQTWNSYKAVLDGPLALGMKVIVTCWAGLDAQGNHAGTVDLTSFWPMWDTVVAAYGTNNQVYFEVLNEPFGYAVADWKGIGRSWLSRYFLKVPPERVLIGGTGYDDNVAAVASDPAFSDCLFSQHLYADWFSNRSSMSETDWVNQMRTAVGTVGARTIVTEFGCAMGIDATNHLPDFQQETPTNPYVVYFQGMTRFIRESAQGGALWQGLADGDSFSLTNRTNDTLTVRNASAVGRLQWGWRLTD